MRGLGLGLVLALAAARAGALLTDGQMLTNFASATFSLPSGSAGGTIPPGMNSINLPNSASAWVLVTDQPQMCMQLWKYGGDCNTGAPLAGGVYPGQTVGFQIGFSNCGAYTASSVVVTDVMPGNTVRQSSPPGSFWVGGTSTLQSYWATALTGPWYNLLSPTGQVGPLYLRWIITRVGYHQSGFIRYCVSVQ